MATNTPELIHEETICCNYKRCPTVQIFDDGSAVLSDDDAEGDSFGKIRLRSEVMDRLVELHAQHKK